MKSQVKFNQNGKLANLVKKLKTLHKQKVEFGYFEEQGYHSEAEMPYTMLMRIHEYGEGTLASRPVLQNLSNQMSARGGSFRTTLKNELCQFITKDNYTAITLLNELGAWGVHKAHRIFGNPAYLLVTYNPTPLVDTGELAENFAWKVSLVGTVNTL